MTKYFKLLMVALFATLSFTLTSCGDDDEPNGSDGNIIGTWQNVGELATSMEVIQYLQFKEGGVFIGVEVYPEYWDVEADVEELTWSLSGNTLKIDGAPSTIKSLSKTKLVLETMGISQEYKKVSDSIIDDYIN